MKTYSIELYRAVEDDDGDFGECQEHVFSAREVRAFIRDELMEAGYTDRQAGYFARKFTWTTPEFLEFDSGNPSHACGYWHTELSGPDEVVDKIEAHYEAEECAAEKAENKSRQH